MRVAVLTLVLLTVVAGCLNKPHAGDPTTSPPPSSSSVKTYADYEGNWSAVNGTFQLYSTKTLIQRWTNGSWQLVTDRCTRFQLPFLYDPANETLWLSRDAAVHPSDPGPLTAVWIQEEVYGPQCNWGGFFGVNEDPMARSLPLLPSRTGRDGTYLLLNVSFHQVSVTPPRHNVTIANQTFDDGASGNVSNEVRDRKGDLYRAAIELRFLGEHPYGWIRRF
jgi:hypothetical protein